MTNPQAAKAVNIQISAPRIPDHKRAPEFPTRRRSLEPYRRLHFRDVSTGWFLCLHLISEGERCLETTILLLCYPDSMHIEPEPFVFATTTKKDNGNEPWIDGCNRYFLICLLSSLSRPTQAISSSFDPPKRTWAFSSPSSCIIPAHMVQHGRHYLHSSRIRVRCFGTTLTSKNREEQTKKNIYEYKKIEKNRKK